MKKTGQKRKLIYVLMALLVVQCADDSHAGTWPTIDIRLNGIAQGGVLSLSEIAPLGGGFVSVVTTQGESAEAVLNRLADEVCRSSAFNWRRPLQPRPSYVKVTGNTLTLPFVRFQYGFSGSDQGFVSVKPVLSVSGLYDAEEKQISLSWINPPENYDAIEAGGKIFPPNTTNCVYSGDPTMTMGISFALVRGKRGDAFSPPVSIIIRTNSQEELDTFPFYMGLAPNWSCWSDNTKSDAIKCEQGLKPDVDLSVQGDPWDKSLYQIVRTTQRGVQGGVWRKFLGLKPSHTYKIEVRFNTLEMDVCTNEWEFSFHAASDYPGGQFLSPEQMAGVSALPDGSKGAAAGRVVYYTAGMTTNGKWKLSTTDKPVGGLATKNITLPEKVTSITVWLRLSGLAPSGVGMDWIRVVDVTDKL